MTSRIRAFLHRFAADGLALQEFTAFLGVRGDPTELREVLEAEDRNGAYAGVSGLQSLRWVLFQPGVHADTPESERANAPYALVLSCAYEGEVLDLLEELVEKTDPRRVLSACRGFEAGTDVVRYLTDRQVRSGYMFRDPGPLTKNGDQELFTFDATRVETTDAFDVQRRFERFYVEHAHDDPASLRAAFLAAFGGDAFPYEATPFERPVPDEARWVRRLKELSHRVQVRNARQSPQGVLRGAHAKGHGLVEGELRIEPLELRYRVGLFANPGTTFPLWVRPSNGSPGIHPDGAPDARGFSFSVGVPLGEEGEPFARGAFLQVDPIRAGLARQDFVMFSEPVFFAADLHEFTTVFSILATRDKKKQLLRGVAFLLAGGGLRRLSLVWKTFKRRIANPLVPAYHSATPYRLGEHLVTKYSVEPADPELFARVQPAAGDDFLSTALRASLAGGPVELKLFLHVIDSRTPSRRSLFELVEDATIDWARYATKVHAATLVLGGNQDPSRRMAQAERWQFNPWNALAVHRPLGSLNRARWSIYRDSAAFRTAAPVAAAAGTPDAADDPPPAGAPPPSTRGRLDAAE